MRGHMFSGVVDLTELCKHIQYDAAIAAAAAAESAPENGGDRDTNDGKGDEPGLLQSVDEDVA